MQLSNMQHFNKALCILFVIGWLVAPAVAQQAGEQRRIEYLINAIANLHDARFVRNGSEYDAQRAADHLRSKLRYAGSSVRTAEDFIVHCATGSSISGEKYLIVFADGRSIESAAFLRGKLKEQAQQVP